MNSRFNNFFLRTSEITGISTLTELAKVLGVNRSAVSQARRKDSIPAKWLLTLFHRYRLNPGWLEDGKGPKILESAEGGHPDFHNVPKVEARLSAGGGSFDTQDNLKEHFSFRTEWLRNKGIIAKMVLMEVFGNSMEPEIKDGDTVLIDQSQNKIIAGAIFAVGIEDTILVKRIEKHPQKLVLLSDNKAYDPIYLSQDEAERVRIIGKVLWICREMR